MKSNTLITILLCLLFPVGCNLFWRGTETTTLVKITDKERDYSKEGGSGYLVFSQDETFKITDSWTYFRFASSDLYGQIERNKIYYLTVYGFRIPFLSMYRNILSAQEAKEK